MKDHVKLDSLKGIPALRFFDRLDGYVRGVRDMAQFAKDLRMQEAIEAEGGAAAPKQSAPMSQEE